MVNLTQTQRQEIYNNYTIHLYNSFSDISWEHSWYQARLLLSIANIPHEDLIEHTKEYLGE